MSFWNFLGMSSKKDYDELLAQLQEMNNQLNQLHTLQKIQQTQIQEQEQQRTGDKEQLLAAFTQLHHEQDNVLRGLVTKTGAETIDKLVQLQQLIVLMNGESQQSNQTLHTLLKEYQVQLSDVQATAQQLSKGIQLVWLNSLMDDLETIINK